MVVLLRLLLLPKWDPIAVEPLMHCVALLKHIFNHTLLYSTHFLQEMHFLVTIIIIHPYQVDKT